MIYKRTIIAMLVLIVALFSGCAAWNSATNPSPLSPQEQFLMKAEQIYISQTNDYLVMTKIPNPSEDQKKVMRAKREALVQAEPLIKIYRQVVFVGGVPDPSLEAQISALLTSIGGAF